MIGGDLVETVHGGAEPKFEATGVFSSRGGVETIRDLPVIWSYAFAEGNRRGLVLVSLDTSKPHAVAVAFDGKVTGGKARQWLLTAEKITANNEFESARPQVRVIERTINDFQSGARLELPPFSMLAVSWQTD